MTKLNLLIVASPAAPIAENVGKKLTLGGVRALTFYVVDALKNLGHNVRLIAPAGSDSKWTDYPIEGTCADLNVPDFLQHYPITANSVLSNMWEKAYALAPEVDAIVNLGTDWLPYYLMPMFPCPILNMLNISAGNDAVKDMATKRIVEYPHHFSAFTNIQRATYTNKGEVYILPLSVPVERYRFYEKAEVDALLFLSRIAPEKNLEEAALIARESNHKLVVHGTIENEEYWQNISKDFSDVLEYRGALETKALEQTVGRFKALIFSPKWVEAFGLVVLEALAGGMPVIVNDSGGPAEFVPHGKAGFIYPKGDIVKAVEAVNNLGTISRATCRSYVEKQYSMKMFEKRLEGWLERAEIN